MTIYIICSIECGGLRWCELLWVGRVMQFSQFSISSLSSLLSPGEQLFMSEAGGRRARELGYPMLPDSVGLRCTILPLTGGLVPQ